MLSVAPEKELGRATLTAQVCAAPVRLTVNRWAEHYFHFALLHKSENPLQISLGQQKEVIMEVVHESKVV